ncbi:DNA polymerase III subunit alpha [Oceanicella actignis]|uniref:DNA polymerase III subunit alpha n=1 Tax=Oceanicella actignis TaxID=1189325 RepID=UPI0011E7CF4D|nr:DNA polymerase III subunit alpha [Oceanicella actignis]TYO90101.1 DNA polymerase III alpha subunit [Oceanicella actignis]
MTATDAPRFIHLRVHSAYSLIEGAIHVKALPKLCAERNMPAVAVTDTGNLFAALEFSETMAKAGIQPIVGAQLALAFEKAERPGDRDPDPLPIVLLAQNETGYLNLMALVSFSFLESGDAAPHVTLDQLAERAEGLICLSGGPLGPVGALIRRGRRAQARALLERLAEIFPDRLYVELQRHGPGPEQGGPLRTPEEEAAEPGLVALAYELRLPLVATNDVYFDTPEMFEAHDAFICIAEGAYVTQENRRRLTPEHHFKTQEQMCARFNDLPEAVENTVEIARRCAYRARTRKPILPRFADDEVQELRRQANEGLQARLAVVPHAAPPEEYQKRLDFELDIIERMGFPGYFLIVADFIKWAKDHDIPVGPGRGSGAGSLVAWALTITDLDPLRYSLLFERFLNPERVSMPDFDIDFCMDRREEVIAYVQQKYGRDRVAQIITFGALLSKAAVRDVGRVLQMPYGQCDRLSKMIPVEGVKPVSIKRALEQEPRLREEAAREPVVAQMLDYAGKLEGLLRNASTHAAGVVIGDRPLHELVPLYRDPRSDMPATQFNMKWVEQAGLVKFDFLGLKTLTVIQGAVNLLRKRGVEVDISRIPIDDPKTYELYASAQTVAVFQVESAGMREALRLMKPTCIEDIVALVALYRPGPMENIPKYCAVKHGKEKRESIHPLIDHILEETQGIIVYQEQVMQIAQVMAGYSLGGADLLRRAMGKKIKEAMDAERPKFIEGARKNGVPEAKAREVFDLLEKFANYGFNKSHAAAYALVSYQTAWLKANHPVEFMAAVMNCDIHLTDKLAVYLREVKRLGIEVVPPDVNRSEVGFAVEDGRILYGLAALKNVGADAMRLIVEARAQGGPFADLFDFARRVDLKKVGKRPLENLARAGAFDALERNRRRVFESLERLVAWSAAVAEERASSQSSLFGEAGEDLPPPPLARTDDWLPTERLTQEQAAVGFYLTGHPLDDYRGALERQRVMTYAELARKATGAGLTARIAGTVLGRQERMSARGSRFAFVQLSDPTGMFEATVFSEALAQYRDILEPGSNVVLTVEAHAEGEDAVKLLVRAAQPIDAAVAGGASMGLRVFVNDAEALPALRARLEEARAAAPARGRARGPVNLVLLAPDLPCEVELALPGEYPLSPQVAGAIKAAQGVVEVEEF